MAITGTQYMLPESTWTVEKHALLFMGGNPRQLITGGRCPTGATQESMARFQNKKSLCPQLGYVLFTLFASHRAPKYLVFQLAFAADQLTATMIRKDELLEFVVSE
uniref:Uncharacterized protein n=1 Tax=Timema bartmani TaxID=61472 RepID=A0A7R9I924_9NEOP|nr:unnamed protein product [Timema bartmani]